MIPYKNFEIIIKRHISKRYLFVAALIIGMNQYAQGQVFSVITPSNHTVYFQLENERLKAGIYEFATDIAAKSDLRQALEDLSGKFDNGYMDFLCIAILQAFDTGKVVDLLKDTSEVIRDMEKSYLSSKKTSLDRKVTFYQLGLVAAILMVVIYGCIRNMYSMTAGI